MARPQTQTERTYATFPERIPGYRPGGCNGCDWLERNSPLVPKMHTGDGIGCFGCHRIIYPGEVTWAPYNGTTMIVPLCRECGIAWEIDHERMDWDTASKIPTHGEPYATTLPP
jgi:hypothetical protein